MKSLEIVNERIESLKYYIDNSERIYYSFYSLIDDLNEMEKIKKDLEILKIIKNKTVNIEPLKSCLEEYENDNKTLEVYNYFQEDYRKLTLEELLKLKQWLEENENDR